MNVAIEMAHHLDEPHKRAIILIKFIIKKKKRRSHKPKNKIKIKISKLSFVDVNLRVQRAELTQAMGLFSYNINT